jgi:hypothetical protein
MAVLGAVCIFVVRKLKEAENVRQLDAKFDEVKQKIKEGHFDLENID